MNVFWILLDERSNNLVTDGQTDGRTNSLTPCAGVYVFFLSVKIDTFKIASLAGGLLTSLLPGCHFKTVSGERFLSNS